MMWYDIAVGVVTLLLVPAMTALMLKHFPSRYEFSMHLEHDNQRFAEVRNGLNRIESILLNGKK